MLDHYPTPTESLQTRIENWGYTRTADFNGKRVSYRRQELKVIDAARVPADFDGSKQCIAVAVCEGKRGAQYEAWVLWQSERLIITVIG